MAFGVKASIWIIQVFIICLTYGADPFIQFFGTHDINPKVHLPKLTECGEIGNSNELHTIYSNLRLVLFSKQNCSGPYLKYNTTETNMSLVQSSPSGDDQVFHVRSWLPYMENHPKIPIKIDILPDDENESLFTYLDVCECINLENKLTSGNYLSSEKCFFFYEHANCNSNPIQRKLQTGDLKGYPEFNLNNFISKRINEPVSSFQPCNYPQHCRILQADIKKFELLDESINQTLNYKKEDFISTMSITNPTNSSMIINLLEFFGSKSQRAAADIHFRNGFWSFQTVGILDSVQFSPKVDRTFLAEMLRGETSVENLRKEFSSSFGRYAAILKFTDRTISINKNITIYSGQSVNIDIFVNIASFKLEFSIEIVIRGKWGIARNMRADELKAHLLMNDHLNLTYLHKLSDTEVLAKSWCEVYFETPLATVYNVTKK